MTALECAKQWWRPAFSWAFIAGWIATCATTLGLLWIGSATLSDASGLLIAMLAAGAAPATTYTYGRTTEKRAGVADQVPANFQGGN